MDGRPAGRGAQGAVLPLPDRARRVQGAAAPHRARDLLRAEGGLHRGRGLRGHEAALRETSARGSATAARGAGRAGAGARLPGVAARRQLHLPGHACSTALGPDGRSTACRRAPPGVFTDATLLPVVFPGLMDEVESHLGPGRGRPAHRRHRLLQQRLRHPPPGARSTTSSSASGARGRAPARGDACSWAAWPRAPSRRRRPTSRCSRRSTTGSWPTAATPPNCTLPRDPRPLQPLPQARAVLRERAEPEGHHRPHRLHDRRRRDRRPRAPGAGLRWRSPSPSRASATRTRSEQDAEHALADAFGPIAFAPPPTAAR